METWATRSQFCTVFLNREDMCLSTRKGRERELLLEHLLYVQHSNRKFSYILPQSPPQNPVVT